jgi:hypothetical protein
VTRVLVAGSYPPIPRPAARSTVNAVLKQLALGHQTIVVSPRASAAHYAVPIVGPLAGRRLDHVRLVSGTTRLVLCIEAGLPFSDGSKAGSAGDLANRLTANEIVRAMRRFDHTTLVITSSSAGPHRELALLRAAADEVDEDLQPAPNGETPSLLGPPEPELDRALRRASQAARIVLGSRWEPIRARAYRLRQSARRG